MVQCGCAFGTKWDLAFITMEIYMIGSMDLAFLYWELTFAISVKDHLVGFCVHTLNMIITAFYTQWLVTRIAIKLAVTFAVIPSTLKVMLTSMY